MFHLIGLMFFFFNETCFLVCVCVGGGGGRGGRGGGVCVCVCGCLYSFTVKASSVCNDVSDILEGTDQRSCVVSIFLGASVTFLHLRF